MLPLSLIQSKENRAVKLSYKPNEEGKGVGARVRIVSQSRFPKRDSMWVFCFELICVARKIGRAHV